MDLVEIDWFSFLSSDAYRQQTDMHFVYSPFWINRTPNRYLTKFKNIVFSTRPTIIFVYTKVKPTVCEKVMKQLLKHTYVQYKQLNSLFFFLSCGKSHVEGNLKDFFWPKFWQNLVFFIKPIFLWIFWAKGVLTFKEIKNRSCASVSS